MFRRFSRLTPIVLLFMLVAIMSLSIPLNVDASLAGNSAYLYQIHVVSANQIKLEVAFNPNGVTAYQASTQFRNVLDVLPGNFHHGGSLAVAGMLIVDGKKYYKISGKKNRPVIAQEWDDLGGKIILTTIDRAWADRSRYRVAVEIGPFLIVNGEDWNYFDFPDASSLRYTYRIGIGFTTTGELFWAWGEGTLPSFRSAIRYKMTDLGYTIDDLANIDGGSSASPGRYLPSRIVITQRPENPNPIPDCPF